MKNNHVLIYITLVLILIACNRNNKTNESSLTNEEQSELENFIPQEAKVKIYFENTLSMDGYINGNTDFKNVLRELLVAVDNEDKVNFDTEFFLVNNKLIQENFGGESIKITEKLNPKSTANKGNKGSSDFEEIIDKVLRNHTEDDITIITADFIYSPKGEPDTPSALSKLKTYTENAFLKATSDYDNLQTRIYWFESSFNGSYYNIDDKGISGINNRPYYYFVVATSSLMKHFEENIGAKLKKNDSYQSDAFFTTENFDISYNILNSTAANGRLRVNNNGLKIHGYPKQGNLQFTVLLNLKNVPLSNDFLKNSKNYTINNPDFYINKIGVVQDRDIIFDDMTSTKITGADYIPIKNQNFTHAIQFETEGMVKEDLKFSLKKKIPTWVENIHSENDRNILSDSLEQNKTFGFLKLVEGISDAYINRSSDEYYFNIEISIEK